MSRQLLLNPGLLAYLESVSLREPEVLAELRRETSLMETAEMQIGPVQGQFLGFLVSLLGVRRILEVGTFTGYSALWMALHLPEEGLVDTCDIDPETTAIARRYWESAGVTGRIRLHLGPALETLERLAGEGVAYDLAFLDADKPNVQGYFEWALKLLKPGGLALIDNVLWSGRVADPQADDDSTAALRRLNAALHSDPRVDMVMLPLGDGLTMVRKR